MSLGAWQGVLTAVGVKAVMLSQVGREVREEIWRDQEVRHKES